MNPGDVVIVTKRINLMAVKDIVPGEVGILRWADTRRGECEVALVGRITLHALPMDSFSVVSPDQYSEVFKFYEH